MKKVVLILIGLILLILVAVASYNFLNNRKKQGQTYYPDVEISTLERTYKNYASKAIQAQEKEGVPAEYLLALVALESSGRALVPIRFEKHVYEKLQKVQASKLDRYNNIDTEMLQGKNAGVLRKLASSWGPCQIMGYYSLKMNIEVEKYEGKNGLIWAAKWINLNYPHLIATKKYKDAFHMHNAGSNYPKFGGPRTHNKKYVNNGLVYLKAFQEKLKMQNL